MQRVLEDVSGWSTSCSSGLGRYVLLISLRCDEAGYFYVVDRLKELIKVKGLQVRSFLASSISHSYHKEESVGGPC